jgi:hypothetical protein
MAIKKTNTYLQNTTQKTKDRATRTTLITGGELGCSERGDFQVHLNVALYS